MEIGKLTQAYSPVPSVSPQIISTSFLKPFKFLTRRTSSVRRALSHDFSGVKMSAVKLEPSLLVKQKASELANVLKGASVFLVGMNCSLKTELGTRLADALRYYYFDSDDLVEQAAGGKAAAISLRETDEKGFRDSETEVLKQLSSMGRLVVCAGDGAVQSSTNLFWKGFQCNIMKGKKDIKHQIQQFRFKNWQQSWGLMMLLPLLQKTWF